MSWCDKIRIPSRKLPACYRNIKGMPINKLLSNGISREGKENNWKRIYSRYQASGIVGRLPTDQEVEQARIYINDEHTKKLKGVTSLTSPNILRLSPWTRASMKMMGCQKVQQDLKRHMKNGLSRTIES